MVYFRIVGASLGRVQPNNSENSRIVQIIPGVEVQQADRSIVFRLERSCYYQGLYIQRYIYPPCSSSLVCLGKSASVLWLGDSIPETARCRVEQIFAWTVETLAAEFYYNYS